MVTYIKGDIFRSPAKVLTNPVNCVGVMGKGLALEFKKRYPDLFDDYRKRCNNNTVIPGKPYLWSNERTTILNFPTKRHWKDNSRLEDIEAGLKYLEENWMSLGIDSIALPAIGCGEGGLHWDFVKKLIDKHLGTIPGFVAFVYLPR